MDLELRKYVEKIIAGEKEYFDLLVKHFQQPIYNLVFRMINQKEEAKDVTQEVFLKVYKNISNYDQQAKVSTWIYRIATNTCIDYLRKKREMLFKDEKQIDFSNDNIAFTDESKLRSPQQIYESQELSRAINQNISALPEKYRAVVILKYINDLTFEEIAKIIGEPENTVKTRLYRGRELLRKDLAQTWAEERGK